MAIEKKDTVEFSDGDIYARITYVGLSVKKVVVGVNQKGASIECFDEVAETLMDVLTALVDSRRTKLPFPSVDDITVEPLEDEETYDEMITNRAAVLRYYRVDAHGTIIHPGRFEGQKIYVPYFWNKVQDGWVDHEDHQGWCHFRIENEDRREFPELGSREKLAIARREDGHIVEQLD